MNSIFSCFRSPNGDAGYLPIVSNENKGSETFNASEYCQQVTPSSTDSFTIQYKKDN